MRRESTPPNDDVMVFCPKLWHLVPFSYCRREDGRRPCARALDCWYDNFLVEVFFREVLSPEDWAEAFDRPPKDRMSRLLEAVGRVREPA